ncbi:hypothetical protein MWU65_05520 [Cellulophaga sp. F20128]|uniref:hypothetical protein n=1 Tax=Cellulophaga sp. F20128 TaxID=2926413 RepID=UPI001FF556F8|nr:hypothetical protein [Cellulophaga sp. F20128]MCK0156627.1 hypothetical protein [Cellulophaga sp. F20128]
MIKNRHFFYTFCYILIFALPVSLVGQEPHILTVSDFDLIGNVKKCTVITNYGKEEFNFNAEGQLTKSVTRYTDEDYSITYYKYSGNEILEKRLENYREGVFDKSTSIAHFYAIDTTGNKRITEKIITYGKRFLDQYEYRYDSINRLVNIKRINDEEIDETAIVYEEKTDETLQSYVFNGLLVKSIRTYLKKNQAKEKLKYILTKEFSKGSPIKAEELVYREDGTLFSKEYFGTDEYDTKFISDKKEFYTYREDKAVVDKIQVKTKKNSYEVSYLHQFDGDHGNWIKQVISPDNTYTTRKIEYYPSQEKPLEE